MGLPLSRMVTPPALPNRNTTFLTPSTVRVWCGSRVPVKMNLPSLRARIQTGSSAVIATCTVASGFGCAGAISLTTGPGGVAGASVAVVAAVGVPSFFSGGVTTGGVVAVATDSGAAAGRTVAGVADAAGGGLLCADTGLRGRCSHA